MFPAEAAYRAERQAFLATIESLSPDEFEHGTTLCAGWAPRDVLSHLLGIDQAPAEYVKAFGNVGKGNARIVERMRRLSADELRERATRWAEHPAPLSVMASFGLLGDLAIHHQDVLRGLGRTREVPAPAAKAILREGAVLGLPRLKDHKVVPNDVGRALGRGKAVRGTAEALGMWLAGRDAVASELVFAH
jgi:uncharacterized protein (TIGR03083 family)